MNADKTGKAARKVRILLVDDEHAFRLALRRSLVAQGFEILDARTHNLPVILLTGSDDVKICVDGFEAAAVSDTVDSAAAASRANGQSSFEKGGTGRGGTGRAKSSSAQRSH